MDADHRALLSHSDPGRKLDHRMAACLSAITHGGVSRRGLLGATIGALAAAAAPTRCSSSPTRPMVQAETTFRYGLEGDVHELEPAFAYDTAKLAVVSQISEGLLMFDTAAGAGSRIAASGTKPTPSGKASATSSATRTTSRVLPTPPGPTRVTSGESERLSNVWRASTLRSRPTSEVRNRGRGAHESPSGAAWTIRISEP
jgi:hypothetical protein